MPDAKLFRELPSVDELLRSSRLEVLIEAYGQAAVASALRAALERFRKRIAAGTLTSAGLIAELDALPLELTRELRRDDARTLKPVINATGVILHTNLGRAPLAESAIAAISEVAGGYSNLEFDLASGARGKRDVHAEALLAELFAANRYGDGSTPRSIVVNNCAAAVLLALNSLAEGGEVIVSRGELVEIGGSFRVPEVMAKSGAVLREVGTTNRTRLTDYADAITDQTKLILRVHRSNFAIVGFAEQPSLAELVELGRKHGVPVLEDLGNGALLDLREVEVHGEPGVHESLAAGVDLVCYSGDKLLGGPQAGVISGRAALVEKLRRNPLFRALRADKLTYAALSATLQAYAREHYEAVPTLRMMRVQGSEIRRRAEAIAGALLRGTSLKVSVEEGESLIGGGTAPTATLRTYLLKVAREDSAPETLLAELRKRELPIVARAEGSAAVLDLRTVFPEQDAEVLAGLRALDRPA